MREPVIVYDEVNAAMRKQWRPVPGWECETSEPGQVRTWVRGLPYVLARSHDPKGYPQVTVGGRTVRVHKLIALAWLPKPRRGQTQVRHLDGDKENCAAWNLKHGNQQAQEQDKRHAGTSLVKRGMEREGSGRRGKERNRTGASRAQVSRTSRTWPS